MADIDKGLPNTRTQLNIPGPEQEVDITEQQQQPAGITPEEDGGATIDFDPNAMNQTGPQSHFDNLADILPEDVLDPVGIQLRQNYTDYKMSRKIGKVRTLMV